MQSGTHRCAIAAAFFGNLLVVPGMVDLLARDLSVSVPTAGGLLSLVALIMCVGGPLTVSLNSQFDWRKLLVAAHQ